MFTHRTRLASLFFAPLIVGLNYIAHGDAPQESSKQAQAALISLAPSEVPGPTPSTKDKARCGTFEVFEDREHKAGRKIALKIFVYPATGTDKAPAFLHSWRTGVVGHRRRTVTWRSSLRKFANIVTWS